VHSLLAAWRMSVEILVVHGTTNATKKTDKDSENVFE
jgi:hypothetical protein